jgi:hypothetical protein
MRTSTSGFSGQVQLVPATAKDTLASIGRVRGRVPAWAGEPEMDQVPAGYIIMDSFVWHSISCACNSCIRNDDTFRVTFSRQDFRPYLL